MTPQDALANHRKQSEKTGVVSPVIRVKVATYTQLKNVPHS
jgi:hypothetical protein